MTRIASSKLTIRLFILTALSFSLWFFSGKAGSTPQENKEIAVDIIKQLEPTGGVIPVEIRCAPAHLTAPNQVETLDCKLKNSTSKNITAANIIYSIVLAENGSVSRDTHNSFLEALVHPDFKDLNKLIGPGEERFVGPAGPISYPAAVIKTVEMGIDYVEFEDGTTLGPDEQGSQITKSIRAGAAKYKGWLSRKYIQSGESAEAIIPLLQQESALPDEIGSLDQYQEIGAKAYRDSLRRACQTRGKSEVKKLTANHN
jgi:hypothetical protein